MSILKDWAWKLKYTPDHGNLVKLLYEPMLECAVRYDRLTGYFSATALALAARGVEGLIRNGGRMRMVVGCTLDPPEIEAIQRGEELRTQVDRHLTAMPLMPTNASMAQALELLAWMVAQERLEVRVGVPCDASVDRFPPMAYSMRSRASSRIKRATRSHSMAPLTKPQPGGRGIGRA
jgi:hypothetical protein